jgi:hypothetical protein
MIKRTHLIAITLTLLMAGPAAAATKIVQQSHQDAFTVMGKTQPAMDSERVIWLDTDRLRMDDAGAAFIVRLDLRKMYIIDHDLETVSAVDLPVDLAALLPAGVADQMLPMLQLEVEVTPTDETKKVGEWNARRYNVKMTSNMVTVEQVLWVTKEIDVDLDAYYRAFHQILSLQPGTEGVLDELRTIDGFTVEEQAVTKMSMVGEVEMRSHDVTLSVETLDAPAGLFEPPATYTVKEFDLMAAMQGQ